MLVVEDGRCERGSLAGTDAGETDQGWPGVAALCSGALTAARLLPSLGKRDRALLSAQCEGVTAVGEMPVATRSEAAVHAGHPSRFSGLLDASRGHGRSLSRLQLAHMPVSTARLGPVRSYRCPGTPGPSVKTRTERRSAGSRQTSTRTCSAGGRSTRDAGESRVAARRHERALAIADGAVASTPEPVAAAGRPGRSRVSGHAASSQTRDSQVSHSPFSAVWVAARPLRLLSNLDVWKRPCQAPAFVVVQESAPRA